MHSTILSKKKIDNPLPPMQSHLVDSLVDSNYSVDTDHMQISAHIASHTSRYRLGLKWSVWQEFKHTLAVPVFFSGLGYHLLVAMLGHMFSWNMSFGITVKEIQKTNFFKEVRDPNPKFSSLTPGNVVTEGEGLR